MKSVEFLTSRGVDVNKSLELFGDINTYNDTIGDFLIGAKDKTKKLEIYKNENDMANYAIYVHSLKSDARYFGFNKLADMANEHERESKAGNMYYIREHFSELMNEVVKNMQIVEEYLKEEDGTSSASKITPGEKYENKTILVVDDSNIIRNFVKRIFNETYEVGTAKDGEEAIGIIEANKNNESIVAILLDLNMPKVDGFAVLDYMTENDLFTQIPVSIISGDSSKETIDRAFTYQIVDMLGKPFNELDVKRVIEKTLYFKEMN